MMEIFWFLLVMKAKGGVGEFLERGDLQFILFYFYFFFPTLSQTGEGREGGEGEFGK